MIYSKFYANSKIYNLNHSAALSDVMREWLYEAYKNSDCITLRDTVSMKLVKENYKEIEINYVPDSLYGLKDLGETNIKREIINDYESIFDRNIANPYLIISGTSAIFRADRKEFTNQNLNAFNNLIKDIKDLEYDICLLVSDEADYKLLTQASIEFNLPIISYKTEINRLISVIKNAKMVISGRWHTSILALKLGVPCILGDANFLKLGLYMNNMTLNGICLNLGI